MDVALLLQYAWVLVVLIALEGILATDNAVVLAMMVRHLPERKRKKALFYGLAGAFIFRFASLFLISLFIHVWQIQAVGALYLLYLAIHFFVRKYWKKTGDIKKEQKVADGFWLTVIKVEIADIVFAMDSMLAAVALAMTLPATSLPQVGQLDGGQFLVILCGGMIGIIVIRFTAGAFIKILMKRPGLETGAYVIIGWVGVKLALYTLSHPKIALLAPQFIQSTSWEITFWAVLVAIVVISWLSSKPVKQNDYRTSS